MDNQLTADFILQELKRRVAERIPIAKEDWLEVAFKLNTLMYDENAKLYEMKQAVAIKKRDIMATQEKRNVADAEVQVECLDEYKFMRMQEAKLEQILEFIRISKKNSDLL